MTPDLLWPILRESLAFLHLPNLDPADLVGKKRDHHFSGFALRCRNRFIHPPGAALHRECGVHADSASSRLAGLIARHGEADEATWRRILAAEPVWESGTRFACPRGAEGLADCGDDALSERGDGGTARFERSR